MPSLPLFYPSELDVPSRLVTAVFTLTPLTPDHVEVDYAALLQSKTMLRLWSGSDWPQDDFTLADNLEDLEWHWLEHQERMAFTYTVLNPEETLCLGCVYLTPLAALVTDDDLLAELGDYETAVRFWVTQPYLAENLDRQLLQTLINWFNTEWAFSRVVFHTRQVNEQQLALLADEGLDHRYNLSLPRRGGTHQFWELTKYMAVKTASMVAKSAFADWN